MSFYALLVIWHAASSVVALASVTFRECVSFVVKDTSSFAHNTSTRHNLLMRRVDALVQFGTTTTLATGLGIIFYFFYTNNVEYLHSEMFWAKMCMLVGIGATTMILRAGRISHGWGSSILLSSWWMTFAASVFVANETSLIPAHPIYSFLATIACYGAVTVIVAAFIHRTRCTFLRVSEALQR
jgi:uncharacterized membrane protein